MNDLRLAFVGCGAVVALGYAPALAMTPGVRVVAVADPDARARARARAFWPGCRVVDSTVAALDGADAVVVAAPPSAHLDAWRAAAAAGLPVLMEKPLLAPGATPAVLPTSPLLIDFNRRFWEPYRRLRSETARRVRIVMRFPAGGRHRADPAEGGALYDIGSHAVDLACFLTADRIARVRRWDGRRLALTTTRGADVSCELGYSPLYRESVWVDDRGLTNPYGDFLSIARARLLPARSLLQTTLRAVLERFVAAARGRAPYDPGIDDALHVASVLEEARCSR